MSVLRDILVPVTLLKDPDHFGGTRDGDCLRGDLVLGGRQIAMLRAAAPSDTPRMMVPALIEAHCHLDKCHTISRLGAVGGDLRAAIDAQLADKTNWTEADLRQRMTKGLSELQQSGCQAVRSHVDWGDTPAPPTGWSVLNELAGDFPTLLLQTAALTGIDKLADADFCNSMARGIAKRGNGILGGFILDHDEADIRNGLKNAFAAAEKYGLALDFHVDEGLGNYNGLEAICDMAIALKFEGPILCGHAVSLMDRDADALKRIIDKLLRARIFVCALPTTNLYLQGRQQGTPDRRGITRLRELHAAGVPIVVGSDNVADAFCPMGQHDPRTALHLAALGAHLDPPMGDWLPAITTNAARALGLDDACIENTKPEHLRLCAAATTADLAAARHPLQRLPQLKDKAYS
ncbi:MAG: amidohydrolase family protein [Roseobacter sp.]|jgi:cytosine deaminase